MESILAIIVGLGLAASCGFRIFIPPLIVSAAALTGHLDLIDSFEWMGTYPALIMFATATLLEVAGHYIPVVDNFLNIISSPAAVIAGMIVSASVFTDMNPFLTWSLAIIAGGGVAGMTKGFSAFTRLSSTATTGGLGNPILTTVETIWSIIFSIISIILPILAAIILIVMIYLSWHFVFKRFFKKKVT